MAITKNLVVTLKDDIAELKDKMFIFRNDVGVEMIIELKDFEYSIDAIGNKNNFSKVSAIFRTPSGKLYSYNDIKVSSGKIRFVFTQDLINVMQEIGEYELQFQLYDKLNNRLTIPSYNFYVKEPLCLPNEAIVGEGTVGFSYVAEDETYLFSIENGYIKTEWEAGDLITKGKLNKIENAIFDVVNVINNMDITNNNPNLGNQHTHNNMGILNTITADKINQWNNKSDFDGNYNNLINKPPIPTEISDLINDVGYLTSIPDEYVTDSELNSKGYLTEHQDISGKVDKISGYSLVSDAEIDRLATLENYDDTNLNIALDNLTNAINKTQIDKPTIPIKVSELTNDVGYLTTVPSEYITETELNSKGYLTQHQDISHKADKTELHSHSNKDVLDGITTNKITEWDNKSNFSGNYNDLTNKPTIPSLNGYATEQYVNEEIEKIDVTEQLTDYAKKSELHSHNNKSVLDGITSAKITEWDNKSTFDGNYNSLTNKPTIPTKVSELTNDIGYITEYQDIGEKVEPSDYDVPKVFFTSSDMLSLNSKNDGEKIVEFEYISKTKTFRSYATVAIQGTTSASFPKKNYTLKLYKDSEKVEKEYINLKGWGNQTKFCLKANYVDTTHTRNLTGARIGYDMVESRPSSAFKTSLQSSPRNGLVDGFPIKVFVNGMFHGVYTWNIPKDTWQFNNPQMVLCAEKNNDGVKTSDDILMCEFRKLWDGIDGVSWSVESGTLTNTLKDSFNRCVNFVMNSTDAEFKNNISQYFDLYSLLDYYCFSYLCCHLDGLGKNMLMVTYDGVIWGASLYDMDSLFGAWYDGSKFVATNYKCPEQYQENNSLLWERIEKCFAKELYARYKQLRKGALSLGNIVAHAEHIYDLLSERDLSEEKLKWTGLPSIASNTIPRFRSYMQSRAIYVDNEFELFNAEPVPITGLSLDKSNITVNVGSNDTLTVTYIPSNTNQRGVIWESSDTTKATVSDGVITGVSNGNCTITAKSIVNSNIVATCSVTVQQSSSDIEVIEKSNYLENMNYTTGKIAFNTGQYSTDGTDYVSDFIALNPGVYAFSGTAQTWKGYGAYNSLKEFSHFYAYAGSNEDLYIPILETCYIRTKNAASTNGVSLSLQSTTIPSYNFKIEADDVSDFVNGYPNRISHPIVEIRLNPTRISNAVTQATEVSKIEFSDKSIKGFRVGIYQTKVYIQISFPNFTSLAEAQNYLVSNNVTVTVN